MFTTPAFTPTTHQPAPRFCLTFRDFSVRGQSEIKPPFTRRSTFDVQRSCFSPCPPFRIPNSALWVPTVYSVCLCELHCRNSTFDVQRSMFAFPLGTVPSSRYRSTLTRNHAFSPGNTAIRATLGAKKVHTVPILISHGTCESGPETCVFRGKNALSLFRRSFREDQMRHRELSSHRCFQTQNHAVPSGNTHATSIPC
jgi:hypothetical protein